MTIKITGNSTVCSTACSRNQQGWNKSFALLALCEGNLPVTGGFPHKGPVMWKALLTH